MDSNWARFIEVYKDRMTIGLALLLGMVTLTGYGLTAKQPVVFLMAACVPIVAFFFDFMIVYHIATPFLYKAFFSENNTQEKESMAAIFLAFGKDYGKDFEKFRQIEPGPNRQIKFRKLYAFRSIALKVLVFTVGSVGELLLWLLMKNP